MNRFSITTCLFIIIFCLPNLTLSWDSIGNYTHDALGNDATQVLSQSDYPDIYKFQEELKDGSESEQPHPGNKYNGGNANKWWEETALLSYEAFELSYAYFQIGQVAHLTQDQAVPAHAANVPHGPANFPPHRGNFQGGAVCG